MSWFKTLNLQEHTGTHIISSPTITQSWHDHHKCGWIPGVFCGTAEIGQTNPTSVHTQRYTSKNMCLALLHSFSPLFICEVFVSVRKWKRTGFTRVWKCNYNSQQLLTQQSSCRSALNISVGRKWRFNSLQQADHTVVWHQRDHFATQTALP